MVLDEVQRYIQDTLFSIQNIYSNDVEKTDLSSNLVVYGLFEILYTISYEE